MEYISRDEPLTPEGRLFTQQKLNIVMNCAIGFRNPIDIEALKTDFLNSYLMKHPRFSSLLVLDHKGREFWRKTHVNIDDHFIIHHNNQNPISDQSSNNEEHDHDDKINAILADFAVSSPLSTKKPLWEFHIISELKCMIFRFHHALGDGITLMSMFLASCKRFDENGGIELKQEDKVKERKKKKKGILRILKTVWWSNIYVMKFTGRSLWVKDKNTVFSGGDGVELWPRMVATAKFDLQDMKIVKRAVPGATINDVLFGVLSSGFSKYLTSQSPHGLKKGIQITGIAMVNLRRQPGIQEISTMMEGNSIGTKWGNKFGLFLLPIHCHTKSGENPLENVKKAKKMLDRKKQSLEAHFSYKTGKLAMSLFGPKVPAKFNHKIISNSTFTISNVVGPQEVSAFGGNNPMTFMRVTSSSLSCGIMMHMVSYAGKAEMQILVAKDIIPEPRILANCFQDSLIEMKNAALLL
ncbi:wax ester synthase/diacylglycerol acyltransferase 4-like [Amaranthus tricolor]|uniref:wax ester synthase/diacylglycerol acyltransferase 4-like n=1 Tax=Amaranthus tricolor TaxID=29722 RepID=UPI0025900352|nr:wax ester synthase/diacylglycerol acyltransferase 4-like [Amaranthus tricolor]